MASLFANAITRALGGSTRQSFLAGIAALLLPWTVFTTWAPGVPEMPCVAWMMASAWFLVRNEGEVIEPRDALFAGMCASMACGHRYEAWFATSGIALALLLSRSRRAFVAFALAAIVVPIAWIAINAHRSGDPFDFVHRVVRYRSTVEPHRSMARDLARVAWEVMSTAGFALVAATLAVARAQSPRVRRHALVLAAGASAVILGNILIEIRGGGATHHAARTWLLTMWFAMPLALIGVREPPQVAMLGALLFVQDALGWRSLPRDVDVDTVRAGRSVAPMNGCYAIETGRLDFLWVEYESTRPDDARADRAFGAPAAEDSRWTTLAEHCPIAVTHSHDRLEWLSAHGFRSRVTVGAWTISERTRTE